MKLVHDQTSKLLSHMCEMIKALDRNKMRELHVIEALFLAVERGNVEFVRSMLNANPELGVIQDEYCRNIFMHAIQFRQPKIFSLIYKFNLKSSAKSAVAYQKNNMLHIAAKLARNPQLNRIPGAALQMQSELQWFQEVKSIVPSWALNQKNLVSNMTPDELFTDDHKQLVIEAEKWMKETATSCTVVGALIITIMFAAAFTVPGGNNQDSGFPIFLNKKTFMIFIISDALSLFSSTTSVLMFLGILTSRYAEQDFLESLPRKLMFGLFALFFSIVSMMVAFCATLLLALRDRYSWIFIPLICLASIPATLFVFMQSPLLVDIFRSTYGGGIFDKKAKISK
nr:ankyrin repeat-containing protein ITN1-like [Ziziphus jujuba var. spinosa]